MGCSSDAVGRDTCGEVTDLCKPEQKQGNWHVYNIFSKGHSWKAEVPLNQIININHSSEWKKQNKTEIGFIN